MTLSIFNFFIKLEADNHQSGPGYAPGARGFRPALHPYIPVDRRGMGPEPYGALARRAVTSASGLPGLWHYSPVQKPGPQPPLPFRSSRPALLAARKKKLNKLNRRRCKYKTGGGPICGPPPVAAYSIRPTPQPPCFQSPPGVWGYASPGRSPCRTWAGCGLNTS